MAKIEYALEEGGPKRLEISWKGNWQEFTVRLDGEEIGSIADGEELRAGQEFALDDGSTLHVQLLGKFGLPRIHRDGRPLSPHSMEPAKRLAYTYKIIFMIGAVNVFAGLSGRLTLMPHFAELGFGLLSVVAGGLFILLGFFVMRRSRIAMGIASGLFAVDTVCAFFVMSRMWGALGIIGLIMRILILLGLAQGLGAIRELREKDLYGGQNI